MKCSRSAALSTTHPIITTQKDPSNHLCILVPMLWPTKHARKPEMYYKIETCQDFYGKPDRPFVFFSINNKFEHLRKLNWLQRTTGMLNYFFKISFFVIIRKNFQVMINEWLYLSILFCIIFFFFILFYILRNACGQQTSPDLKTESITITDSKMHLDSS